jgi:hypothetical protein
VLTTRPRHSTSACSSSVEVYRHWDHNSLPRIPPNSSFIIILHRGLSHFNLCKVSRWHGVLKQLTNCCLRAAAHQLRQDKHQDMRQKTHSCFIRESDSSPHTEVARVCALSHLL